MRNDGFFANPSFRAHLLWVSAGFTAALLAVGGAAVFVPLFQRFDAGVSSPDEMLRLTGEILEAHARYWPVVFVSWLSVCLCSWFLYGRMRSPLFRFVSAFRAISAGSIPGPVIIRATDYVQDECAELNAMLSALEARARTLERIEERVAELAEAVAATGDSRLIALCAALENECKALRSGSRS
jgi:hypothetical protein